MSGSEEEPRYRLLGVVQHEVETRKQEPDDTVFTWPHFLVRHAVIAGATIAVVFALAIAFDAPLQSMADANVTPQVAKAPWYFAGLQELLAHIHPMVAGILVPGAALAWLVLIPYMDRGRGWRIRDRKMLVTLFTVVAIAALILTLIGSLFRGPEWSWTWPWEHLYLEL